METVKLDNHIYDDNKVIDRNGNIIFQGNFEEVSKFVVDKFNENLPLGLDIKEFEDFNGREFKVELGFIIPQEVIDSFIALENKEIELNNIYNELFGKFSIKNTLNLIKTKEI